MLKRNEVFEQAKDLHVATVMVYPNESKVLFYDEAFEHPVLTTELKDLFIKGMTIVAGEEELVVPVGYTTAGVVTHEAETFTATAPVEE